MTKFTQYLFISMAMMTIAVCLPLTTWASGSWVIERSHANMELKDDGKLRVTESLRVNFEESKRTGVERVLPLKLVRDGNAGFVAIKVSKVQRNHVDEPYQVRSGTNEMVIVTGDERLTLQGVQEYAIEYEVAGVLQHNGKTDQFYWQSTGGWDTAVEQSTATLSLAKNGIQRQFCRVVLAANKEVKDRCQSVQLSSAKSRYSSTGAVPAVGSLWVGAEYTAGLLPLSTIKPPTVADWFTVYRQPLLILGSISLGSLLLAGVLRWRNSRIGRGPAAEARD